MVNAICFLLLLMAVVDPLIDPLGIVKDSKELNNIPPCPRRFRKAPPVFQYPRPMRHTVGPLPW